MQSAASHASGRRVGGVWGDSVVLLAPVLGLHGERCLLWGTQQPCAWQTAEARRGELGRWEIGGLGDWELGFGISELRIVGECGERAPVWGRSLGRGKACVPRLGKSRLLVGAQGRSDGVEGSDTPGGG